MVAKPRGNPNMVPGGPSLNPSGRPKGAAGLSKYIDGQTRGGEELVDRLLVIARDPKAPVREALAAVGALIDRLAGKPMAHSEVSLAVEPRVGALPVGFSTWPLDRQLSWVDEERGRRLSLAGGDS